MDKVHDYLTTENYNDLKGQIDSERTNRQEADNELNLYKILSLNYILQYLV